MTEPGERAGFISRLAAFGLDALIVSAIMGGAAWLLELGTRGLRRLGVPLDVVAVLAVMAPLVAGLYFVGFWTASGQTPGKWVLGIRVIRLHGGRLTVRRALLRWCACLLSTLPFYLGYLWVLGPSRLAWHDRIAGTEVVHVPLQQTGPSLGASLRRRLSAQRPRPAS